ncbi:hypothetical protein V3C99_000053 [Haemonchus contortus]|uniref:Late endosomal/lysosomal adaptor and MAPK and MTOR activator 5 n=1 Tax=Haemonchus contortus TaxID=6289 RepID=A0A7I4YEM6_HAECO
MKVVLDIIKTTCCCGGEDNDGLPYERFYDDSSVTPLRRDDDRLNGFWPFTAIKRKGSNRYVGTMESLVEKKIDQLMAQPGIVGVCVSDANGLSLSSKGSLKPEVAPLASQLLTFCSQLEPSGSVPPVVCVTSDHGKVIFSNKYELILVLHQNT